MFVMRDPNDPRDDPQRPGIGRMGAVAAGGERR